MVCRGDRVSESKQIRRVRRFASYTLFTCSQDLTLRSVLIVETPYFILSLKVENAFQLRTVDYARSIQLQSPPLGILRSVTVIGDYISEMTPLIPIRLRNVHRKIAHLPAKLRYNFYQNTRAIIRQGFGRQRYAR